VRVLVTGCTTAQVGRRTQLNYANFTPILCQALRDAGHHVDNRVPLVDDPDLASYDVVLVGHAPLINFAATYAWPAMWTVGNARKLGVRLGSYVDDWRLFDIRQKYQYVIRNKDKLLKEALKFQKGRDWVAEHPEELQRVARAFMDGRPWPPIVAPMFGWGAPDDPRWLQWLPTGSLTLVDPGSYVTVPDGLAKAPEDRERAWVSAALENPRDVVRLRLEERFGWPLERFGSRLSGEARVQEEEVLARYGSCWGVISIPHNRVTGMGWWRARFNHAALLGCVLSAWPEELANLGLPSDGYLQSPYTYSPSWVERASTDQLAWLAAAQRSVLESWQPSREQLQEQLDGFIQNLV